MKRSIFILLWGFILNTTLIAGGRFVEIEFKHSLRGEHNEISIRLDSVNNNERIFYGKLITIDKRLKDNHPTSEKVIDIEKDYFDNIYNRAINLNFKEIIKNSENLVGVDGVVINFSVGAFKNYLRVTSWSPEYKSEERKTVELYSLIFEIFTLFDMEEWL